MKVFLFILLIILFGFKGFNQQRFEYFMWPYGANDKITFTETVNVLSSTPDSLFSVTKSFVANKFHSDRDTTIAIDQRRTVVCKGVIPISVPQLGERGIGFIGFTLTLASYHKSYRYSITDIEHFPEFENGVIGGPLENDRPKSEGKLFPTRYWNEEKAKAYYAIQTTIESLKEYINKRFQN